MANPLIKPTVQPAFWVIPLLGIDGVTALGDATGINNALAAITGEGAAAFLMAAQGNASISSYNPLPTTGTIEAGKIYGWGGGLVICRQSHNRTIYAPVDTPALFSVYRAGGGLLEWVANEKVLVGEQRTYLTKTYKCVQPHVTQIDWQPDKTPTLWTLSVDPGTPQPWVQPLGAHDAYPLGAKVTFGGFTWQSTAAANVWAPGVYGWAKV